MKNRTSASQFHNPTAARSTLKQEIGGVLTRRRCRVSKSPHRQIAWLAAALWLGMFQSTANAQAPDKFHKQDRPLPDHYIVVLHDWAAGPKGANSSAPAIAGALAAAHGGVVGEIYRHAMLGFSVRLAEAAAVRLSQDPRVAFVEEDSLVTASADQANAPWGLDRIDQHNLPLNSTYHYNATGTGLNV